MQISEYLCEIVYEGNRRGEKRRRRRAVIFLTDNADHLTRFDSNGDTEVCNSSDDIMALLTDTDSMYIDDG